MFFLYIITHVFKTENKVAEVGEGAVWYRDLLQECPLPWVWGFPGQAVLLWDGLLQRGKSCETGGGIRCDVMTYAAQTQHRLLNTWDADLDSVQLHRFIMLQNTQSETCITSQMMVLHERDLWHNFEYGNEQVTNKEKSHSYIHHFTGLQKERPILFMNVKLSIKINNKKKSLIWNLYKFYF